MLLSPLTMLAGETTIASPNGKLVVTVNDKGGRATYSVTFEGRQLILPSALGFKSNIGDFTKGMKLGKNDEKNVDKTYEMRQVKQAKMHYVAKQQNIEFENGRQQKMTGRSLRWKKSATCDTEG